MDFTPENITAVGTAVAGIIVAVTALIRVLRGPAPGAQVDGTN